MSAENIAPKYDIKWAPPVVTLPNNDKHETSWYLAEDFIVKWVENNTYHKLIVRKGMPTDGASVPQLFWSLGFLPTGTEMGGAIVHDAAYEVQGRLDESKWLELYRNDGLSWVRETGTVWSRKQCDDMFYRFMLQGGANKAKAFIMFQAVRLFGFQAWAKRWPFNQSSVEKGA